jgi:hypothetical protein
MGATTSYLAVLLVGIILVVIDGQLIYRSGRTYLEETYDSPEAAAAVNRLTVGLFHLVVLGLLALLSTLDTSVDTVGRIVATLGLFLLVLAIAHAITIGIYGWLRSRQQDIRISDKIAQSRVEGQVRRQADPGIDPDVPEQHPQLAPPLDPPGPAAY